MKGLDEQIRTQIKAVEAIPPPRATAPPRTHPLSGVAATDASVVFPLRRI